MKSTTAVTFTVIALRVFLRLLFPRQTHRLICLLRPRWLVGPDQLPIVNWGNGNELAKCAGPLIVNSTTDYSECTQMSTHKLNNWLQLENSSPRNASRTGPLQVYRTTSSTPDHFKCTRPLKVYQTMHACIVNLQNGTVYAEINFWPQRRCTENQCVLPKMSTNMDGAIFFGIHPT